MPQNKLDPVGEKPTMMSFKIPKELKMRFDRLQFSQGRSHLLRQILEEWVTRTEQERGIQPPEQNT